MSNEIFKISFNKHHSEKFKDFTSLNDPDTQLYLSDYSPKHPYFTREKVFTDEQTFVDNFGNPMYSVQREHLMVVIEEKEEKISLKIFWGGKDRRVGKTWFRRTKNVEFLTVNRKTGDFYFGYLHNYQKKRKFTKSIRRNYFLGKPVSSTFSKLKNILNSYHPNPSEILFEVSSKFLNNICPEHIGMDSDQRLMKFYLDKKGFKYPNNFWVFSEFMWGKDYRKVLKKNQLRIVDTFMQLWGIKGKKVKKYLHEIDSINIHCYIFANELFGDDWMNQDGDFIKTVLSYTPQTFKVPENFKSSMSLEELRKVYSSFKETINGDYLNAWTFQDHINTYSKLKDYGETDLKWLSDGTDYKKFQEEHYLWSEKLDHYRKGSYTRTYPQYFYDSIEKEIDGYFPVILKSSEEYNKESYIQQNCVKGYIGRVSSMIISLRKGELESETRATIEYRILYLKNFGKIHVDRVQTLGKYNQRLDETWNEVLFKLDEIVLSCHQEKNFESVKISKLCANGTILASDSHFDENGNLTWTNKKHKVESYYDEW
jgi:hypothetical protein